MPAASPFPRRRIWPGSPNSCCREGIWEGERLLSADSLAAMQGPEVTFPGLTVGGYGFALIMLEHQGHPPLHSPWPDQTVMAIIGVIYPNERPPSRCNAIKPPNGPPMRKRWRVKSSASSWIYPKRTRQFPSVTVPETQLQGLTGVYVANPIGLLELAVKGWRTDRHHERRRASTESGARHPVLYRKSRAKPFPSNSMPCPMNGAHIPWSASSPNSPCRYISAACASRRKRPYQLTNGKNTLAITATTAISCRSPSRKAKQGHTSGSSTRFLAWMPSPPSPSALIVSSRLPVFSHSNQKNKVYCKDGPRRHLLGLRTRRNMKPTHRMPRSGFRLRKVFSLRSVITANRGARIRTGDLTDPERCALPGCATPRISRWYWIPQGAAREKLRERRPQVRPDRIAARRCASSLPVPIGWLVSILLRLGDSPQCHHPDSVGFCRSRGNFHRPGTAAHRWLDPAPQPTAGRPGWRVGAPWAVWSPPSVRSWIPRATASSMV